MAASEVAENLDTRLCRVLDDQDETERDRGDETRLVNTPPPSMSALSLGPMRSTRSKCTSTPTKSVSRKVRVI